VKGSTAHFSGKVTSDKPRKWSGEKQKK